MVLGARSRLPHLPSACSVLLFTMGKCHIPLLALLLLSHPCSLQSQALQVDFESSMAWDAMGHLSDAGVHGDGAAGTPGCAGAQFEMRGRRSPSAMPSVQDVSPTQGKLPVVSWTMVAL